MPNQWYYGRGADISGPVSDKELFDLATEGTVLRTDTVWRDDNQNGVPAERVRNLFVHMAVTPVIESAPVAGLTAAPDAKSSEPLQQETQGEDSPGPPKPNEPAAYVSPPTIQSPPTRPARASAGKGAVIVSQDGKNVRYRGKCTTCGHEDTSWKTMAIPRGTTRATFYCTKCRKRRDIEINGYH
jgi:hypothetical protein